MLRDRVNNTAHYERVIIHAEIETSGRMTTHLRVRYERAACNRSGALK